MPATILSNVRRLAGLLHQHTFKPGKARRDIARITKRQLHEQDSLLTQRQHIGIGYLS